MKKNPRKQHKGPQTGRQPSRPAGPQKGINRGKLSEAARAIAAGAQEVYEKSDRLDKKADALHQSAHSTHKRRSRFTGY